jgi:hypothetical protein
VIALLAIAAWGQQVDPVPPELVGSGVDTAAWVLDRFGWPGLIIGVVIYMWRTRNTGQSRWRGLPLLVQVEVTPESAYLIGQAARGKRVPSELARKRAEARRLLEEADRSGGDEDDPATTPGGGS